MIGGFCATKLFSFEVLQLFGLHEKCLPSWELLNLFCWMTALHGSKFRWRECFWRACEWPFDQKVISRIFDAVSIQFRGSLYISVIMRSWFEPQQILFRKQSQQMKLHKLRFIRVAIIDGAFLTCKIFCSPLVPLSLLRYKKTTTINLASGWCSVVSFEQRYCWSHINLSAETNVKRKRFKYYIETVPKGSEMSSKESKSLEWAFN